MHYLLLQQYLNNFFLSFNYQLWHTIIKILPIFNILPIIDLVDIIAIINTIKAIMLTITIIIIITMAISHRKKNIIFVIKKIVILIGI